MHEPRFHHALVLPLLCAAWFLVFAIQIVVTLPPFQGADEAAHLYRVEAFAQGVPVPYRIAEGVLGGPVDPSLREAVLLFEDVKFAPGVKVSAARLADAEARPWSGQPVAFPLTSSSLYSPALYAPLAGALALAKQLDLGILDSTKLVRLSNALVSAGLLLLAMALLDRGRTLAFALALLPMTVFVSSYATQDGLLFALSMLVVAILSRAWNENRSLAVGELAAATLILVCLATGKPPGLAFAGLLLGYSRNPLPIRLLAVALVGAAFAGWTAVVYAGGPLHLNAVADPAAQLAFLLADPLRVFAIAGATFATWGRFYVESFVGQLGWLDVFLPPWYHLATQVMLGLAALGVVAGGVRLIRSGESLALATALLVLLAGSGMIFGSLYLGWTEVGKLIVNGVQGRYFLPFATLLVLIADRRGGPISPLDGWIGGAIRIVVVAWPLLSIPVVLRALTWRYYIG
ncbi:DUF2142 domain-containing protein [Devosia sp.]|uniref:DUF2142 domain-containing protein n=1 Tax=Devosia sp. TaxID=1871048 RepID=UPI0035B2BE20